MSELIAVFAGPPEKVELLRGILVKAGLKAFIENEYTGTMAPFAAAPAGLDASHLVVPEEHVERARSILEGLERVLGGDADTTTTDT